MDKNHLLDKLRSLNFTAVDVETANESRNSLCSIGVVKVERGVITREICHHIRPRELRVSALNQQIHSLSERDLETEEELNSIWDSIRPFLENQVCVAHNAAFDFDVLMQSLHVYGLRLPKFKYLCSLKLAQQAFPGRPSYRLRDLASAFSVELNHHFALSDAKVCAEIAIRSLKKVDFDIFDWNAEELTSRIEKVASEERRDKLSELFSGKRIDSALLKPDLNVPNKDNIFYNKRVVFTGNLQGIQRSDAAKRIQAMGADINTAISKRTNIVIVGDAAGPAKLKKIEDLVRVGCAIEIMYEKKFLAAIGFSISQCDV